MKQATVTSHGMDYPEVEIMKSADPHLSNPKRDAPENKTWRELLYDYCQSTTFHGINYVITISKYLLRKVIWFFVILLAVAVFAYLFIQRLVHYYDYPRAVNMELTFKPHLPFPAVTICNQNMFRLTKVQERGLYDVLTQGRRIPSSKNKSSLKTQGRSNECEDFDLQENPYTCVRPDYRHEHSVTYKEVTLNGCKYLCAKNHGSKCFTIIFMPIRRSCILLPRLNVSAFSGGTDCVFAMIYQRRQCLGNETADIWCDFEYENCPLIWDTNSTEEWRNVLTTSEHQHILELTTHIRTVDAKARLKTKFMRTDGYCLQVYVMLIPGATFRVYIMGEDLIEKLFAERQIGLFDEPVLGYAGRLNMILIHLPKGVNQIILEGVVLKNVLSTIKMDDVRVAPCSEFFESTCSRRIDNSDYVGNLSVSVSGSPCKPWPPWQKVYINEYARDTIQACRFLPYYGFICYTENGKERCAMESCDCRKGYRPCDNGACLPSYMFCNGVKNCEDGSDETTACADLRKVDCDFNTVFLCGYHVHNPKQKMVSWNRMDASFEDLFKNNASYMVVESTSSMAGVRGEYETPLVSLERESCLSFDFFITYTDTSTKASLAVVIEKEVFTRRLWVSSTKGRQAARVNVPRNQTDIAIGFLATMSDPSTSRIAITNVRLLNTSCKINTAKDCGFRCDDGSCINKNALCDGVSDCMDETDEENKTCSDRIISQSCDFDNKYMCGYRIHSNYQHITWVPHKTLDFSSNYGIMAAEVTGDILYSSTVAYLIAPKITINSGKCFTFRYFNNFQAKLELYKVSIGFLDPDSWDGRQPKAEITVDGGKSWHFFSVNLEAGSYYLQFESSGLKGEQPLEKSPVILAAVDDVVLHDTTCYKLTEGNSSMSCAFEHERMCGYNVNSTEPRWSRVKRQHAFYLASYFTDEFSNLLKSPYAVITTNSCVAITTIAMLQRLDANNMPVRFATYTVTFYDDGYFVKHEVSVYVEHATASYRVISFNGVVLNNNRQHLRMEIAFSTPGVLYIDRVEVIDNCQGGGQAARFVEDPEEFANYWTSDPYRASHYDAVAQPNGYYHPGFTFSYDPSQLEPKDDVKMASYQYVNAQGYATESLSENPHDTTPTTWSSLSADTVITTDDTVSSTDDTVSSTDDTVSSTDDTVSLTDDTISSTETIMTSTVAPHQVEVTSHGGEHQAHLGQDLGQSAGSDNTVAKEEDPFIKPAQGEEAVDNLEPFYADTGHQLADLIYRCIWENDVCKKTDFHSHVTDLGYCHTFNADISSKLNVSTTGSGFGLSLIVNLEQYEYIESSNTDAGIKVYLYDQDDVPMIKDLGFAISPGVHALVATSYSSAEGLRDPYGTCDEAPLPFYSQDATYTYSRCQQQCNSNYTTLNCSCRDAYMPGDTPVCNLTKYLDCLLPIKEQSGFTLSRCSCPDACTVKGYGVDLSYSSLSSLTVKSLLGNDLGNITSSYRNSLEISHRVRVLHLGQTVETFSNISEHLKNFILTMEDIGRYTLSRVNFSLHGLEEFVALDFNTAYKNLMDFRYKYVSFLGQNVSITLDLLQKVVFGINQAQSIGTFNFANEIKHLIVALENIGNSANIVPPFEIREHVPQYLWEPGKRMNDCMDLILFMVDLLSDSGALMSGKTTAVFLNNVPPTADCLTDYERVLDAVLENVKSTAESCQKYIDTVNTFDIEGLQSVMDEELTYITKNMTHFGEIAKMYMENKITKLQLSEKLNSDVVGAMNMNVERLLHLLDLYIVGALRKEASDLFTLIPYWYRTFLSHLLVLTKHFENNRIEKVAREMNIWRVPIAILDSETVANWKYENGWRTWPLSYSLTKLLETELGDTIITNAIRDYIVVVNGLLYELEDRLITAKTQLLSTMTQASDSLEEFRKTAEISPEFVQSNFLKMDVYFPTLKHEAVEQIQAYGIPNFLSEVGGYMGLLIGGSVLSLCEILDLIIYNLVLKCSAGHISSVSAY